MVAAAFALLVGLGVWQMRRLAWKEDLLAHIAALRGAPARPIGPVLTGFAHGADAKFKRVAAVCGSPPPAPQIFRYAVRQEEVGWRLITACPLASGPYDGILIDRGLVEALAGVMAPRAVVAAPAVSVVGVLLAPGPKPVIDTAAPIREGGIVTARVIDADSLRRLAGLAGLSRPAPLLLGVERETPPPAGVTPAALPQDIPNNHLVYALTWFALAGILLWFYGAMLVRRRNGR